MANLFPIRTSLAPEAWRAEQSEHAAWFDSQVQPHVERRSRHEKDPVGDFLFEYYRFRPIRLGTWTPGLGVELVGASESDFSSSEGYVGTLNGRVLDLNSIPADKREAYLRGTEWIANLLQSTHDRPPRLGCHGLHEWAMLYEAPEQRHEQLPLRVDPSVIKQTVDDQGLRCTHFDAFRFFTPTAAPRNPIQLSHEVMSDFEQPGCLHANMDVYRWSFKRYPWVPSDVLRDAFNLAMDIRTLDMASSPYELGRPDISPVPVETPEGRQHFAQQQRAFSERAQSIRARLIQSYSVLLEGLWAHESDFANTPVAS